MTKSQSRNLLSGSACALIATFFLPSTAIAQVTCSGTTTTINCVNGATTVATGSKDTTTTVTPGPGLVTTSTTNQTTTLTATAPFTTSAAAAHAVRLTSGGNLTFTVSGEISATGTGATGILASATGGPLVINVGSGSVIQGVTTGISMTSGAASTSILNLNGTLQNVNGTGSALVAAGGAATINIGTAGRINGASTLTAGNDVINNAGFYNAVGTTNFGAGVDAFNNLPSGTVASTAGAATFSNLEAFNNGGLITMVNGAATDRLTLTNASGPAPVYTGTGGARLAIDVGANATSGQLSADQFVVGNAAGGGVVSGSTAVNLSFLSNGIVLDPAGVIIVQAATVTGTPFTLAGQTTFGLINFSLEAKTIGGVAGIALVSRPNAAIFDITALNNVTQDLWFQSADAYGRAAAAIRNELGTTPGRRVRFWGLGYGASDRYGDGERSGSVAGATLTYNDRLETERRGGQIGLDFRAQDNVAVGLTGGYGRAEADMASGTEMGAEGYNIGAYAQVLGANGLFAGLLVKHDRNELSIENGNLISLAEPDSQTTGIEAEVGYRTASLGPTLEVAGAFGYARTTVDDYETGFLRFDNNSLAHVRGRFGARLAFSGRFAPFLDAKILHEARRDTEVTVLSGPVLNNTLSGSGRGTWGRFEAGLAGGAQGGFLLSAWAEAGDVRGWGVAGGFRF